MVAALVGSYRAGQSTNDLMSTVKAAVAVGRGDESEVFFESLGRTHSSLAVYSSEAFADGIRKPSVVDSSIADLGADVVYLGEDEEDYESDEDDEDDSLGELPQDEEVRLAKIGALRPAASWVCSLNSFARRLDAAAEHVHDGSVVLESYEPEKVPVQRQGNLDLYSSEEQTKRWRIRNSKPFEKLIMKLWKLVGQDEMEKKTYLDLITRLHHVCCPPPLDPKVVAESAERDWLNDTKGAPLDLDHFYSAIFQVVDIWSETSELSEYLALLKKLINGVCTIDKDELKWRPMSEVQYDNYFSLDSAKAARAARKAAEPRVADSLVRQASALKIQASFRRAKANSNVKKTKKGVVRAQAEARRWLERMETGRRLTADKEGTVYKRRKKAVHKITPKKEWAKEAAAKAAAREKGREAAAKEKAREAKGKPAPSKVKGSAVLLTAEQLKVTIARIYQAKLQADALLKRSVEKRRKLARSKRQSALFVSATTRFDIFVMRFFLSSHGTLGVARRHLAVMVRSLECFLDADDPAPRFLLFARLAGVQSTLEKQMESISKSFFNARLMPHFVAPALRELFKEPGNLTERLTARKTKDAELLPLEDAMAAIAATLRHSASNELFLAHLEIALKATSRKNMLDPDLALWLALPLFERVDALVALRRRAAARVLVRFSSHCRKPEVCSSKKHLDDAKKLDRALNKNPASSKLDLVSASTSDLGLKTTIPASSRGVASSSPRALIPSRQKSPRGVNAADSVVGEGPEKRPLTS